jgi:Sec-independent protein translocase protein TatA
MPEIARKMGKIMAEFRTTTQDFKSTWEREVNIDAETKAFGADLLADETVEDTEKAKKLSEESAGNTIVSPEIKAVDKESFDRMVAEAGTNTLETEKEVAERKQTFYPTNEPGCRFHERTPNRSRDGARREHVLPRTFGRAAPTARECCRHSHSFLHVLLVRFR